jgi:acyl-CoA reductase-like NAD-dependent aldehyde dehydrogenase
MKSSQLSVDVPLKLYIGGEWRESAAGDTLVTFDPATGKPLAEVPAGDKRDVDAAVAAAKAALAGPWRRTLPAERGRILQRTAAIIRRDAEQIAFVESLDSGKPLREARTDIETAARYFEYYAGVADKLQGETIPLGPDSSPIRSMSRSE